MEHTAGSSCRGERAGPREGVLEPKAANLLVGNALTLRGAHLQRSDSN